MGKIHGTSDLNFCKLCDFKSHLENDLTIHLLNHKSDNLDIEGRGLKGTEIFLGLAIPPRPLQ